MIDRTSKLINSSRVYLTKQVSNMDVKGSNMDVKGVINAKKLNLANLCVDVRIQEIEFAIKSMSKILDEYPDLETGMDMK